MKRILLTTTSLILAAGVAHAEVTFSGTAGVALIDDAGASAAGALTQLAARNVITTSTGGTVTSTATAAETDAAFATRQDTARATRDGMFFESYYDFDIKATAALDNGITVALGFDMGAGNKIDYNDDDVLEAQGASIGDADVSVSYAGWTLAVDQDGIDNLFDDSQQEDMSVSGSVAGMSVAFTTDQENSTTSYKLSGTVAGVAVTATGTDNDDNGGSATKIAVSYAMGDLTLKGSVEDESKADGTEDDSTVGVSYKMDALTFGYTSIKPGTGAFGDEWDFSVAYAAGDVAASFATDETEATTFIVDYALGGGASAFAAMHDKAGTDNDLTALGLTFAF